MMRVLMGLTFDLLHFPNHLPHGKWQGKDAVALKGVTDVKEHAQSTTMSNINNCYFGRR